MCGCSGSLVSVRATCGVGEHLELNSVFGSPVEAAFGPHRRGKVRQGARHRLCAGAQGSGPLSLLVARKLPSWPTTTCATLNATRAAVARQLERERHRPVGEPMTAAEARKLTDQIKRDAESLWDKVV